MPATFPRGLRALGVCIWHKASISVYNSYLYADCYVILKLFHIYHGCRKTVGNFIAGTDNSSSNTSSSAGASSAGAAQSTSSGQYDEKNAPHSKLPADSCYYPGSRHCYYLMDIEVTKVGHSK